MYTGKHSQKVTSAAAQPLNRLLMRPKITRLITSVVVVLASAFGVGLATTTPASAYSYGWVYLVFPTWEGNCPYGGSVISIHAAVGPYDDTWSGGDSGDDIIYPRVALGQWNKVDAAVLCKNGVSSYWNDSVHAW